MSFQYISYFAKRHSSVTVDRELILIQYGKSVS